MTTACAGVRAGFLTVLFGSTALLCACAQSGTQSTRSEPVATYEAASLSVTPIAARGNYQERTLASQSNLATAQTIPATNFDFAEAANPNWVQVTRERGDGVVTRALTVSVLNPDASVYEGRSNLEVLGDPGANERRVALDYSLTLPTSLGTSGFDVALAPRANLAFGPEGSTAGAGAQVRLGQNLSGPRPGGEPQWYVFAGADAQALTWDMNRGIDLDSAFRLEDKQIVGDAQAGIAYRFGPVDLSLAVVHRERRYKEWEASEQFAAVSVTVR